MPQSQRIYLDNGATSWPKPPVVYEAAERWMRDVGAPAGRGAYDAALQSERVVADCRKAVAGLVGAAGSDRIVFGFNGTDVLNIAL
ncbi:MAG: aminotransferase class V-fold PLP-dependent enzyme, partial [Planctomycetales bacterium]|nr:aminotransferase class V-fold PLP-dependent enzyme [Planctomycetales bacterium]